MGMLKGFSLGYLTNTKKKLILKKLLKKIGKIYSFLKEILIL
jgi:hypothetical protein